MTKIVTVDEAEGHLAELIDQAEQGKEIIIVKDDKPKVRLVPIPAQPATRIFGQHQGKIRMSDDFDDPLPDEFWLGGNP